MEDSNRNQYNMAFMNQKSEMHFQTLEKNNFVILRFFLYTNYYICEHGLVVYVY